MGLELYLNKEPGFTSVWAPHLYITPRQPALLHLGARNPGSSLQFLSSRSTWPIMDFSGTFQLSHTSTFHEGLRTQQWQHSASHLTGYQLIQAAHQL